MNCPQCQQVLKDDARFCTNCGYRTQHSFEASSDPSRLAPTERLSAEGAAAALDPHIGRVLGSKYEIIERLGEGGMGAVYRARRVHIGDEVAVKLLHHKYVTDAAAVERFRREARAAAQLHHSNVVTIHDYGEAGGDDAHAFIVMELVAGKSLRDLLKRVGGLEPQRAVALMHDICAGVSAAHRRNIVHRDIKPDNIIVLAPEVTGDRESAKVVDFGIAKLRDLASSHTLTQTGAVVGTPYYMSPEQCRGESLDPRADVYSLGAMFYEMLAGRPPFMAETVTGVIAKHLTEAPPALPAPLSIPAALERVVMRALAKDPTARQADAGAFARELQDAASALTGAPTFKSTVLGQGESLPHAQTPPTAPAPSTNPPSPVAPETVTRPAHATIDTPAPRSSRATMVVALLVLVGALLSGLAIGAWLLLQEKPGQNQNIARGEENRNGARRATPTPLTAADTGGAEESAADASNALERAEAKIVSGSILSKEDVAGLSPVELRVLRNAVYARHGRTFNTPELQSYFTARPWYKPRTDYSDERLTPADRANASLIQAAETGGTGPVDAAAAKKEVAAVLENWAAAVGAHDIDAHISHYADTLDTYYKRSNVSANEVRADRMRAYELYSELEVELGNVNITVEPTGTRATATFDKTWVFEGPDRSSSGAVRQEMRLEKRDGRWRITGEKDLQVYYLDNE